MRLTELEPYWIDHGGRETFSAQDGAPVPRTLKTALGCNCPCGCENALYVPFSNPIGPGPLTAQQGWGRTGETFETITLVPSILRSGVGSCGWHGFITNGEVISV